MKSAKAFYLYANLGRQLYTELGGKAQTELIEAAYLKAMRPHFAPTIFRFWKSIWLQAREINHSCNYSASSKHLQYYSGMAT